MAEYERCPKTFWDASHHADVTFLNISSFFRLVWQGKSRVFSILFLPTTHPQHEHVVATLVLLSFSSCNNQQGVLHLQWCVCVCVYYK